MVNAIVPKGKADRANTGKPVDTRALVDEEEKIVTNKSELESDVDSASMQGYSMKVKGKEAQSSSPMLNQEMVINKDQILENLSSIIYETQILSNDSPITKDLIEIESQASKINNQLEFIRVNNESAEVKTEESNKIIQEIAVDVSSMRLKIESLINSFEGIRAKLYPVAEKIALIELEKNPYRIPGDPYRRIQVKKKVSSLQKRSDLCLFRRQEQIAQPMKI